MGDLLEKMAKAGAVVVAYDHDQGTFGCRWEIALAHYSGRSVADGFGSTVEAALWAAHERAVQTGFSESLI